MGVYIKRPTKLNENDGGSPIDVNNITDPAVMKKIIDIRNKIGTLEQQKNTILTQINNLKRDELNAITGASQQQTKAQKQLMDNKMKAPLVKNNVNVDQNGNVVTSPFESAIPLVPDTLDSFINETEYADDVKFTSQLDTDSEGGGQQQEQPATGVEFFVQFKNDLGQTIKGRIYKEEEASDWSTQIVSGSCESFEDLAFDKTLKKYGVLDKLTGFFDDVVEINTNNQTMVNDDLNLSRGEDLYEYLTREL